jgi:transposase-like protein
MTPEERRKRRFTVEFRKEQVELIESGQATIAEVSRRYEVRANNVSRWLDKYGKNRDKTPGLVVASSKDFDRLARLEKEHDELLKLFGEQQVKLVYMSKLVELAKRELGDDFEKKG